MQHEVPALAQPVVKRGRSGQDLMDTGAVVRVPAEQGPAGGRAGLGRRQGSRRRRRAGRWASALFGWSRRGAAAATGVRRSR